MFQMAPPRLASSARAGQGMAMHVFTRPFAPLLALTLALTLAACATKSVGDRDRARFEGQDANGDGRLTEDDILLREREAFTRADTDGNGFVSPGELSARPIDTHASFGRRPPFLRLDADGDGRLTLAEFADPALRRFDQSDPNRDGQVTLQEYAEIASRRRARSNRARSNRDSSDRDGSDRAPR